MKKYVIKMVALLLFASVAISSCSLEYRQRHMHGSDNHMHDGGGDHDHHDDQIHRY